MVTTRYPYVESSGAWDFRSIYYPPGHQPVDEKVDVGSDLLLYADVIREITALAGDPGDMVDAILYWIAYEATCDMRISPTGTVLDSVASLWEVEVDQLYAARLVERATDLMSGAALVGTLRAIAWHLGETRPTRYRSEIVEAARAEIGRCGVISGRSSLVADDAHAHLAIADRLQAGREDLQAKLVRHGALLLCAAHAVTLVEPWNPFVRNRLRSEMSEHAPMIEIARRIDGELASALDQVVIELDSYYAESTQHFMEHVERWSQHNDLEAYFFSRRNSFSGLTPEALPTVSQQFVTIEPKVVRLI